MTDNGRLVMRWRGDEIVNISRAFLDTNGVRQSAKAVIAPPQLRDPRMEIPDGLKALPPDRALAANMGQLNTASQKGLVERFDSTIGARTVLMPFGGMFQSTSEEAMVAKLPRGR